MIKILIKKDGTTTISVEGVKGASCQTMTENIERALGEATSDEKTNEFYEAEQDVYMQNKN